MINLDFYSSIKMEEDAIINLVSVKGDPILEFKGVNKRKVSMSRGGALHRWLIYAFNEMAIISKRDKKTVYLVDVDNMIQEETNKYYNRYIK